MEMRKVPLEEQKRILVDMLSYFDSFCRKHEIEYSITWGTLIGAIRHKGFIPWDDDIDVMLDRKNYEKFLQLYSEKDEKYPLLSLRNSKKWSHTYSRIQDPSTTVVWVDSSHNKLEKHGVWIDIMAIDNVPSDELYNEAVKKYDLYEKLGRISSALYVRKGAWWSNIIPWIAHFVLFPFSHSFFLKAEEIMQSFNNEKCDRMFYWHMFFGGVFNNKPFPAWMIQNGYIDVQFEGLIVRSIKEYDSYLRDIYGDYMQLPPEEKRVSTHVCDFYYIIEVSQVIFNKK